MEVPPELEPARPAVAGVQEVLRAHFPGRSHAYPLHAHDAWTLMVIDQGAVTYWLDRRDRVAPKAAVTLLPPHVPHDGRAVSDDGFRKRVVYLDPDVLGSVPLDRVLATPYDADPQLVKGVIDLHGALVDAARGLGSSAAEERLALLREDVVARWGGPEPVSPPRDPGRARRLRALLDEHVVEGLPLADAAAALGCTVPTLVRGFQQETGMSPHRYLVSRRVDLARSHLLAGASVAQAATDAGFFDQAHLTRHFRRVLGVPPGRFVRGGRRLGESAG